MRQNKGRARAIMIQGTMSNVGKSLLTAGLCRIFHQDGYCTAPFKSQNMALNSFITRDGREMGRAQVVQCEAAGIEPSVLMNPILLKPTSDMGSQVIVNGEPIGTMRAKDYFSFKRQLIPHIQVAYDTLAGLYDILVLEGAGSPAEINLKQDDIVNMGMAKMAGAPVLLAGDIDRGGVFASLCGTMLLLEPEERAMVKGVIINKFRGDRTILQPGLDMLEEKIHIPTVGVVPYLDIDIDDEDSLSPRLTAAHRGSSLLDLAVVRLPRISNFTDFLPLERAPGVQVRYVSKADELGIPDLIFLPGTKNTMGDLLWMRENGLEAAVKHLVSRGIPLFGICGGYQMLGETLSDPEGAEHAGTLMGMGLLPTKTIFTKEKKRSRVSGQFTELGGILAPLSRIPWEGYEIHMGRTESFSSCPPLTQWKEGAPGGAWKGNVYGTYIHGIFDREEAATALLAALFQNKGYSPDQAAAFDAGAYKEAQYDKLADALRDTLDMKQIYAVLEAGI